MDGLASLASRASRAEESLQAYRSHLVKVARNALHSSILADYHAIFWLVHSGQLARIFSVIPRKAATVSPEMGRDQADQLKYLLFSKWANAVREVIPEI